MTPRQLGGANWSTIQPSSAGGVYGAPLQSRKLYYHSLRFVSWDSSRYLAQATRALEKELVQDTPIYVNWNNMAGHWYYPAASQVPGAPTIGRGQINHDWFEFARERGATLRA